MTKLEMVQAALAQLGEGAAAEAVAAFVHQPHGAVVNPRMVPILRASVQEKALLEQFRRQSATLAAEFQARATKPATARTKAEATAA